MFVVIFAGLVALAILVLFRSPEAAMGEMMARSAAAFVVVALAPIWLVARAVAIPPRIYSEQNELIDDLRTRADGMAADEGRTEELWNIQREGKALIEDSDGSDHDTNLESARALLSRLDAVATRLNASQRGRLFEDDWGSFNWNRWGHLSDESHDGRNDLTLLAMRIEALEGIHK